MPSVVRVHAEAYHERLLHLDGLICHVLKALTNQVGVSVDLLIPHISQESFGGSNRTDQDVSFWSDTAERLLGKSFHVADAACSDADAVRSVRSVSVFYLQRVEDVFSFAVGRSGQCPFADSHAVAAKFVITGLIDTLDAQVAVLILEYRMRKVESTVDDTHDDALARIGLGQLVASSVVHQISLCRLAGRVGLHTDFRADVDFLHALHAGQRLEFRVGCVEQYQVASDHSDGCTSRLQFAGHLLCISICCAVHEEVAALLTSLQGHAARRSFLGHGFRLLLGYLGPVGDETLCSRCESTHE